MPQNSSKFMYNLAYTILYFLFSFYELLCEIFTLVWTKLVVIYHVLHSDAFDLPKVLPTHVSVTLGNEEPSKKDLANLVLWCLAANIPYISFYDYKGTLLREEAEFQYIVEKKKLKNDHVIWHNSINKVKNGYLGRKIHVKILTEQDGKDGVANIVKQLAKEGVKSIDLAGLDERFMKQFEFPEPSLVLCCSKAFSIWGYPPWPSRVTEWFHLPTHHNVTFNQFLDILWKFSKCEQRYGK